MDYDVLTEFNIALDRVMQEIEKGEEIQARFIFNSEVLRMYGEKINSEPFLFAVPFWVILNEYLNSNNVRVYKLESSNKKYLLDEYGKYKIVFEEVQEKNK